jgi:type III pantothenate kinase
MLLAIDIGNTNITLGLWDGRTWRLQWRLRTVHEKTADEYGLELKTLLREFDLADAIGRVVVSSVVPPLIAPFLEASRRYLGVEALLLRPDTPTGINIRTDNPAEVGADRIANAVAAYHYYPGPSIVIDLGTATTFDVVSAQGDLLGVAIAPGPRVAADALTSRAAQLSRIALEPPPTAIGRNTIHAVQSGLIFGYVGLVEGLVHRLSAELRDLGRPTDPPIRVIGTGGLIHLITPHTTLIDHVDPWLTLTGLRLISERNDGRVTE